MLQERVLSFVLVHDLLKEKDSRHMCVGRQFKRLVSDKLYAEYSVHVGDQNYEYRYPHLTC